MYNQAHEQAKHGHPDRAVALLTKLAKVYKGTQTAATAKTALDHPKHNLPLFIDTPAVLAEPEPSEPTPPSPPPSPTPVVTAEPVQPQPAQGNATLILPVNPSEMIVAPPPLRDKIESAKANGITPAHYHKGSTRSSRPASTSRAGRW